MYDGIGDIVFGHFRMDCRRRALLVDGKTVPLHARAFDVLECLVTHRDSVLTRDEITAHVWRGMAIGENNLTVQMSALRRALAQHGGDGLIVTFAGRGYRFVGDVTITPPPVAPAQMSTAATGAAQTTLTPTTLTPTTLAQTTQAQTTQAQITQAQTTQAQTTQAQTDIGQIGLPEDQSGETHAAARPDLATAGRGAAAKSMHAYATGPRKIRGKIIASGVALAVLAVAAIAPVWRAAPAPPRLSIVVLPFRNLTAEPSQAYLADAITDDLETELARALKMQVIGRDSAVNVAQRQLSIQQIGRELGVRYVLDGSLQKTEAGYSVNPHLNDAQTGLQLWSVPFTVTKDRFGDLRDTIVRRIAIELGYGLNTLESSLAKEQRPDNPDALDLYYQAGALLDSAVSTSNLKDAAELLERAIEKQPDFSDALAKLGWVLLRKAQTDLRADSEQDRQRAHWAIRQALGHDPKNAAALVARALELELGENCPEAEHVAGEALLQTGSNQLALQSLVNCAWEQGHFDEAAAKLAEIDSIDPVSERHKRRQIMASRLAMMRGDAPAAVRMLNDYVTDHPDLDPAADPMQPTEYAQLLLIAADMLNGEATKAAALYQSYTAIFPHRSVWRIAALDTRAVSSSPRNLPFLTALNHAGMPMFADEAPVGGASCTADSNDFSATPASLPDAGTTVQTSDMAAHFRKHDRLFVIDVGAGISAYPAAKFADHGAAPEDIDSYVKQTLGRRSSDERGLPVIIMGTGPFGCDGYLAATHLLSEHVENVGWYRGGEEGWAQSGLPADDHRKY